MSKPSQPEKMLFRARVPVDRYRSASDILDQLGLTPQDAFNMFLAQVTLHRGLPFPVINPDEMPLLPSRELGRRWDQSMGDYDWSSDEE